MNLKIKTRRPPGTIVYTGSHSKPTSINHVQYSEKTIKVNVTIENPSEEFFDWISVEGLSDTEKIKNILSEYKVDNLVIEDIFNTNQRNKFEVFNDYAFLVQQYSYLSENDEVKTDYISILLFSDKVITFTESENRFTDEIMSRMKNKDLQISKLHEDYLFYVILDMIFDDQFDVYNYLNRELEYFENNILSLQKKDQIELYKIRKNLVALKSQSGKTIEYASPNQLLKNPLFRPYLKKYLMDLEDHIINIRDKSINLMDTVDNIYDTYSNDNSNKINEIMKTLTIFSAIFIPLSFVTGIFGMNFVNFPILQNNYGLLIFFGISAVIPITMLIYFKIKKWF